MGHFRRARAEAWGQQQGRTQLARTAPTLLLVIVHVLPGLEAASPVLINWLPCLGFTLRVGATMKGAGKSPGPGSGMTPLRPKAALPSPACVHACHLEDSGSFTGLCAHLTQVTL